MHYEQYEQKEARFDTDQVSVRINHSEWGDFFMEGMWKNNVRTVFGTDTYKVDIGYSPENDAIWAWQIRMANGRSTMCIPLLTAASALRLETGRAPRGLSAKYSPMRRRRGPSARAHPLPYRRASKHPWHNANKLIELPFETLSLNSLGFVESEEVHGYLYAHNEQGDCFDVAIHDPKQEAWEFGGDVSFFTPLSEEYRVVVFYHIDEKQFTVRLDDNKLWRCGISLRRQPGARRYMVQRKGPVSRTVPQEGD